MTGKMARYLGAYRKRLIVDYAALVEQEQVDHDQDAGEEAKRLIREIIELNDIVHRLESIVPMG